MNDLKVFENSEFGKLEVLMVDGKEYFPATRCAKILGYVNPYKAILDHCKKDGVTIREVIDNLGRNQQMKCINEGNLYRLIVRSKLPSAERFERWVMEEVLPSIRKTGGYGTNFNIEEIIAKTAVAVATEVAKSLMSKQNVSSEPICECEPVEETIIDKPKQRHRKPPVSIISKLSPELQNDVDNMILSGNFTYKQICEYLKDYGVSITQSSVQRRYARLMNA